MAKFVKKPMQKYIEYAYCEKCGVTLNSTYEISDSTYVYWRHDCPKCGHIEYLEYKYPREYYEVVG